MRKALEPLKHHPAFGPVTLVVRVSYLFYKELRDDKAFIRAAGMSYASLIALVPLLVLVFGVLGSLGMLQTDAEQQAVYDAFFGAFFGDVDEIRQALVPFMERIDFRALGASATVALLFVAARLFLMVEQAYSDIFEVKIDRWMSRRILNFYFSITAVPIVMMMSLEGMLRLGLSQWQDPLTSALQFGLLLSALKFLPCTQVRWGPALLGATTSWVLLELGGLGFSTYISWSYADPDYPLRAFYGSLILIPVFLVWLYVLWLVVLLGVEVAHVAQNYGSLVTAERESAERESRRLRGPNLDNALELLGHVARSFRRGHGPLSTEQLAVVIKLSPRDLDAIAQVLEELGLLARTEQGWLMARPPDQIPLQEIAERWRSCTVLTGGRSSIAEEVAGALHLEGTLSDAVDRWIAASEPLPTVEEATLWA